MFGKLRLSWWFFCPFIENTPKRTFVAFKKMFIGWYVFVSSLQKNIRRCLSRLLDRPSVRRLAGCQRRFFWRAETQRRISCARTCSFRLCFQIAYKGKLDGKIRPSKEKWLRTVRRTGTTSQRGVIQHLLKFIKLLKLVQNSRKELESQKPLNAARFATVLLISFGFVEIVDFFKN